MAYFGIFLGMQLAPVEFVRTVLGLEGAHSVVIEPGIMPNIIDLLPVQTDIENMVVHLHLGPILLRI
nr:hypothetical protein [Listeria monocytogenes]